MSSAAGSTPAAPHPSGSTHVRPLQAADRPAAPRPTLRWLHETALVVASAVKLVTAACAIQGALHPRAKRYRGKAMRIRAVGYFTGLGLVPAIWLARGRGRPYPAEADLALSVPLMIDAVGNTIGIYDDARLDDLVHGVNAAVLSSLFGAVISEHVPSRTTATLATIGFGVFGELLWELMEYAGQAIGFKGMMLSKDDTDGDIAAAFLGTAVAAVFTWVRWRPTLEAQSLRQSARLPSQDPVRRHWPPRAPLRGSAADR